MSNYNILNLNDLNLRKLKITKIIPSESLGKIDHRTLTMVTDNPFDIILYQGARKTVVRPMWVYYRLSNGFWISSTRRPRTKNQLIAEINYARRYKIPNTIDKLQKLSEKRLTLIEFYNWLDYLITSSKYVPQWVVDDIMKDFLKSFDRDQLNIGYAYLLVSRHLNLRLELVRKKKAIDYFCKEFRKIPSLDNYIPSLKLEEWRYSQDVQRKSPVELSYEEFLEIIKDMNDADIVDMLWRYGVELTETQWIEKHISLKKQLYNVMVVANPKV